MMGKAEILEDRGDGFYRIKILHNTTLAQARLDALNARKTAWETELAAEENDTRKKILKLQILAVSKQIAKLETDVDLDFEQIVTCADLTEELEGEVGTIEVACEHEKGLNIQPGYTDSAAYSATRDGQHYPFLSLPVSTAMLNFAAMPGIQKWRPTYRYGTITAIDYDTDICSVSLDSAYSYIQSLDVNIETSLSGVAIEYMNCNSAAFEVGDDVIVKWDPYDSEGTPKVIGFKTDPQPCATGYVAIIAGLTDDEAVAWDVISNTVFNIPGITYPATYTEIYDALVAAGYTVVEYVSTTSAPPDLDPWTYCTETPVTLASGSTDFHPEITQPVPDVNENQYFDNFATGNEIAFEDCINDPFYWLTKESNGNFVKRYRKIEMGEDDWRSQFLWEEIHVDYEYMPSNVGGCWNPILHTEQTWEWTGTIYLKPLLGDTKIELATVAQSKFQWSEQADVPGGYIGGESGDEPTDGVRRIYSAVRCISYASSPQQFYIGIDNATYGLPFSLPYRLDRFKRKEIALASHSYAFDIDGVWKTDFKIQAQKNAVPDNPSDPETEYTYDWTEFTALNHTAILAYFTTTNQLFRTRLAYPEE